MRPARLPQPAAPRGATALAALAALVAAPGAAPPARAAPLSHLAWDTCAGPAVRALAPRTSAVTIVLSVTGVDFAHQGFAASFALAGDDPHDCRAVDEARREPADAWRFDVVGCQGPGRARFDFASGATLGCPWIGGAPAAPAYGQHVDPAPSFLPPEWIRFLGTATYPTVPAPLAGQALLLFAVTLDLGDARAGAGTAGTCGGLETPLYGVDAWSERVESLACIERSLEAVIVDADGVPRPIAPGGARLTLDVTALPARAATWGAIKAQYRD